MKQRDWQALLAPIGVLVGALLIALASVALLYVLIQVLQRLGSVIVLFTLGAIVAYVLNPLVNRTTALVKKRWVGMVIVYGALIAGLAILGVGLFQPLITQSTSLVNALRSPTTTSLRTLSSIETRSIRIRSEMRTQQTTASSGRGVSLEAIDETRTEIAGMRSSLTSLDSASAANRPAHPPGPQAGIRIPPSYLSPLQASVTRLIFDYRRSVREPVGADPALFSEPLTDATTVAAGAKALRRTLSSTPILLLDAQVWADEHRINVNVQKTTGQAITKLTAQAASVLNNTATILTTTGTLLLDASLVILISLYFVSDGAHMIRHGLQIVPERYHKEAIFFIDSVDHVLGRSIRVNLVLAAVAGVLGGGGAATLGVPYSALIGIGTFLLELVPVIGPVILVIPPAVIALLFTTPTKAVVLFLWFTIFQQIVTNVIGPRVTSKTVGISPLEAMAAALVGYPLAGFLGSFLAVPVVGLGHVLINEAYSSWKARASTRTRDTETAVFTPDGSEQPAADGTSTSVLAYAAEGNAQPGG